MKRFVASAMLMAALPAASLLSTAAQKEQLAKVSLKVGDRAPDFTLQSDQHTKVTLSEFRGKKNVLLAVYILAFTGG